jgi:hypothetical protein
MIAPNIFSEEGSMGALAVFVECKLLEGGKHIAMIYISDS